MFKNLHSPERHLIELRMEYADTEALIARALADDPVDQLLLLRLHKRCALLRDEINRVECQLDPDEPA